MGKLGRQTGGVARSAALLAACMHAPNVATGPSSASLAPLHPLPSTAPPPSCRRGVALAKQGDLKAALPCYDQALQLDGSNADALVARGAALANKRQWQRASSERGGGGGARGRGPCRELRGHCGCGLVTITPCRFLPADPMPPGPASSQLPTGSPPALPLAPTDDLEAALELQPEHSNARQYLDAVKAKATEGGVRLLPRQASMQEQAADCQQQAAQQAAQQQQQQPAREAAAAVEGEEERQRREHRQQAAQQRQAADDERQRDAADGRGGRKRQRGSSSSRSRSRSRHRARGRTRSRSRSRSRGRRQRSSGSSSSSKGGSGGSDSEAEATAKRLAAAQAAAGGDLGKGMDVATALQIVSSHYKSRHGKKERGGKREHKGGSKQGKHSKQRHKKKKHRRH